MSCFQYDILKLKQIGKTSLKVYIVIHILPTLIFKFKALKKDPIPVLKKMLISYARSVAFLTLVCSLPAILNCYFAKLYGKTDRAATMSGILVGTVSGSLFESPHR